MIADDAVTTAKILDANVTNAKLKTIGVILMDPNNDGTLTGTQLINSTIFTTAGNAARTHTTASATDIIAAIPGAQIGTRFQFTVVSSTAQNVTIAPGTDVTMGGVQGNHVINNQSGTWIGLVTNVAAPAVAIYRS